MLSMNKKGDYDLNLIHFSKKCLINQKPGFSKITKEDIFSTVSNPLYEFREDLYRIKNLVIQFRPLPRNAWISTRGCEYSGSVVKTQI